jgi:molybdopterin-guanine dinucleotide biosynthesis adapter protein
MIHRSSVDARTNVKHAGWRVAGFTMSGRRPTLPIGVLPPWFWKVWMKTILFCGTSNSGKTWMIERLVDLWSRAGLRVAVLKHCSKGYDLDREGKDSARCWASGAAVVGLIGPDEFTVRRREPAADPLSVIAESYPSDLDVVLIEGFHAAPVPQVRVLAEGDPFPPPDPRILAFIHPDGGAHDGLKVFRPVEADPMSRFLMEKLGLEAR